MTKFKSNAIDSGVGLRQEEVTKRLRELKFEGEYLLVSTKKEVRSHPPAGEAGRSEIRGGRLIVDLYTPLPLEKKVSFRWWNPLDWRIRQVARNNIRSYLLAGDHFLVANRRQREYWLKTAQSLGIALEVNDISVFPTGSGQFQISCPTSHGRSPGGRANFKFPARLRMDEVQAGGQISKRQNVVLWFGGIYPWMEPGPLVEAFGRLAPRFPGWKLRFLGGWQPGTGYEKEYLRIKKSAEKKIPARQLEFIPWQAQDKLSRYLFDVGLAVHLVKPTPEDYYAHRVRLLSLTNAGIPVVTSGKDTISDLIVTVGAGKKVENDAGEIAEVVSKLLKSPKKVRSLSQRAGKIEQLYFRQEMDMDGLEKFL